MSLILFKILKAKALCCSKSFETTIIQLLHTKSHCKYMVFLIAPYTPKQSLILLEQKAHVRPSVWAMYQSTSWHLHPFQCTV